MFEQFNVPSMSLVKDCILDLTTTSKTTGVVLDCGYSVTTAVCITDGMPLVFSILLLHVYSIH